MGPRDPFRQDVHDRPASPGIPETPRPDASWLPPLDRLPVRDATLVALAGFLVGVGVGLCVLLGWLGEALFLLVCGGLGAGLAWLIHAAMNGRLHVRDAWQALWRRP
ncbi:MAG: hypothetical protein D6685_00775 [Bacteroidetes bacterium]|nr:hypothetical protein AWN76_016955 [Rhodothermaceae bacterium RA]RMH69829.1 MAG: hypothetical protein D6685_00775 [Bacteroidota bacterium]